MTGDRPAADVFSLLADGTRVDVLRAVAEARHEHAQAGSDPAKLAFSDVYDRVDVENTSRLSYHLGELAGVYLRRDDDGYALTHAGERVVRFILSGNYEPPPDFGPEPVAGTCLFCGASALEATFAERFLRVECTACERPVAGQPVTPAQLRSGDADAVLQRVTRSTVTAYRQIGGDGVCLACGGHLSATVREIEDGPLPDADPFLVRSECESCLRVYSSPLTYTVAYHPASVAFHWDRGVDVTERAVWEFHEHLYDGRWTARRVVEETVDRVADGTADTVADGTADTVSDGTAEYEVTLRRGDDVLQFGLDASATVVRTERVRRGRVGPGET